MNRVLFSIAAVLGGLLPLIFDSALKGAALLAVAALVALALWRISAAARHHVWLVALLKWLTQIACARHWCNPLVWLDVWRLHTERERAYDDLVLASGVRPSAYAEHLLNVATCLSPAHWTSACGLAMARKSSLEGRLLAVLSDKLNRKGVTRALAVIALILGAAIALPVAMLQAADGGKLHIRIEGEVKNAQLVGFEKSAGIMTAAAIEKAGGFSDFADVTTVELETDGSAAIVRSQKGDVGRLTADETGALVFQIAAAGDKAARSVTLVRRNEPALKAADASAKTEGDDRYVKSGIPLVEMQEVVWNGMLGHRIIGDEWRILGKQVKVELWLRNIGTEGVKFQSNMRPDIGVRLKMTDAKGDELKAYIVPNDRPPFGERRLLPPGHAFKVKEFPISLFRPANDVSSVRDHYFPIEPGAYEFHCELELPGFSATGEGGKQLTPAAGEWTGKLTTRGVNVQVVDLFASKSALPKNQYARAQFVQWQKYARANGDIPGGLIALVGESILVDNDARFPALKRKCDGSRDWPAQEAADLLEALAGTRNWLDDEGRLATIEHRDIARHGKPLPPELASLPWGKVDDNSSGVITNTGLRAAFTLEPAAASYAQGTQLPVTIHYHNSGAAPVEFPIGSRSVDIAEATDAQGRKLFVSWVFPDGDTGKMKDWPMKPSHSVRLEPGHWISVSGGQLTIPDGRHACEKDAHGNVLMAPPNSTVKLRWGAMTSTWRESVKGAVAWNERVQLSVDRFSPTPKSHPDRESVIRRITFALTGEEATAADIAVFADDDAPDALAKLTARLQSRPVTCYSGWLWTGEQTFKVTPAAADYRGTVLTAKGPGLYEVADSIFIQHYGAHANFEFTAETEPHPRTIELKDKENRMAVHGMVWKHGSRVVWVAEKERVRKFDLTVPGKMTTTELPVGLASIPEDMREALKKAFPAVEVPKGAVNGVLWGTPHDVRERVFVPRETMPIPFFTFATFVEFDPELVDKLERRPLQALRMGRPAAGLALEQLRAQYEVTERLFEAGSIPSHVFYVARDAYFAELWER